MNGIASCVSQKLGVRFVLCCRVLAVLEFNLCEGRVEFADACLVFEVCSCDHISGGVLVATAF